MLAAVKNGDVKKVAELIRQDPGFDVNMDQNGIGWTLLHHACLGDRRFPVIPLLLAHPDIDVNVKDRYGDTPFCNACENGHTSCVRELLKDSRVEVNEPTDSEVTPFWRVTFDGHLDIIKWWVASGREMDLGDPGNDTRDAIGVANNFCPAELGTLLERFKENAEEPRHHVRLEIGWYNETAAEMFALVVFVSDGLLQINDTTTPSPAARFFSIATQLPLELQMVLCYRVVGSPKEIIPGKDSEVTFKSLAERLMWSSIFSN